MLPYFRIIEDKDTTNDIADNVKMQPAKPRRKIKASGTTVPVHYVKSERAERSEKSEKTRHEPETKEPNRKTFSANFNGVQQEQDVDYEKKISRRYLMKELEKYKTGYVDLQNNYDHLNKKNSKLKEKLTQLVHFNQSTQEESQAIKLQYDELYNQFISMKTILEEPKVCQTCIDMDQNIDTIKKEYSNLRKSSQECQEDCNMLKNVVYRLNVQLERYQEKLRANNLSIKEPNKIPKEYDEPSTASANAVNVGEAHSGHSHEPIHWGRVNTHTLAPLLNAYQEIISEKEEIIENYEAEMGLFTGKLKEVLKENETLHYKLNEDGDCSKVLVGQLDEVKKELKSSKSQNDLLIKKCALKQDKIEEILKCYEQKIDMLKRDYAVLHETYLKTRAEVAAVKEKNKSLMEVHHDFKSERSQFIPLSVHTSSVNECKKWYEELKQQYETEKIKLEKIIDDLRVQINELTSKIEVLSLEKQHLENKLKSNDKLNKKSETKFLELEHNLHEVQLSRSACRKQLHKAMNFAKDLVNEQETLLKALNQRQMENKAVKRIGTDIASRMDLLRNQLKTVQKEAWQELSTVEERIQEQDSIILSMKQEHEEEIDRLKTLIKEKG